MSMFFRYTSAFIGTIFLSFGTNAITNPANALSYFALEFPSATSPAVNSHQQVVALLLAVYGIRDIFMALVIYAAAYFGTQKMLGAVILAAAAVAFADGAACKYMVGQGEWNHWGYAPVLVALGGIILNDEETTDTG